jgi:hypothetical protein
VADEESNYRRVEDEKWRESVQSRLVSLTDSEVTQNDRLDDLDDEVHAIKEMLEGKTSDKDDNGIKGDIHDLSVGVNELRRLMMPDHLGQGGILSRLRTLEKKAGIEEHESDNRWKFRTAVAVGAIGMLTAILSNIDRVGPSLRKFWTHAQGVESAPPKKPTAKTNKKHRAKLAVIEAPTEATDGTSQEDVPEGRGGDGRLLE